jgi:hypothetical protein
MFSPPQNIGSQDRCLVRKSKRPYMIYLSLSLLKSGGGSSISGASPLLFLSGYKDNDLTPMVFASQKRRASLVCPSQNSKRLYLSVSLSAQNTMRRAYILSILCIKTERCMYDVLRFSCPKNSKPRRYVSVLSENGSI